VSTDHDPALPPHRSGRGFRNPEGGHRARGKPADWLRFMREFAFAPASMKQPLVPAGHVLDETTAVSALTALASKDTATWLGHACFLLRLGGVSVLTDPFLGERASPFAFAGPRRFAGTGISIDRLPPIDVVAVSHNHYDHLDVPTLHQLLARNPRAIAVTAVGCGPLLRKLGFRVVHELDWGDTVSASGIDITAVPAVHFSSRGLFDRDRTLWCGFAIRGAGRSVYFAGDTGWGPVFDHAGQRFGPFDLGLVPIGAYDPRVLMQAVHANPEEAVKIGLAMQAHTLAAMHWGTIALTTEPAFEPPQRFIAAAQAAGLDEDRAWVLKIGETRTIRER
jgi:L-ascorbate metabolism protein UlaG (beta-lactamase superfamily)